LSIWLSLVAAAAAEAVVVAPVVTVAALQAKVAVVTQVPKAHFQQ
jgi:hypothetical protein